MRGYSQINVQIVEYKYNNNEAVIRIGSEGVYKNGQSARMKVRLKDSFGQIFQQFEDTIQLKRRIVYRTVKLNQIKESRDTSLTHLTGAAIVESFMERSSSITIYLLDTNGTTVDSSTKIAYYRPNRIVPRWTQPGLEFEILGDLNDSSSFKALQTNILLEDSVGHTLVLWSKFNKSGKAYFDLESQLKLGFIPKGAVTFWTENDVDYSIDCQYLDKATFAKYAVDTSMKLMQNVIKVDSDIARFPNIKLPKINKRILRVEGQIWANAFSASQRIANDSMPINGVDAGSNLSLMLVGLPLKISSLESTQDGFFGPMNQRTLSIDFEKLRSMVPNVNHVKSAELINLEKNKLTAPGGLSELNLPPKPKIQFLDSLVSETQSVKDSISSLQDNAVLLADSVNNLLKAKEDSIKSQLATLRTTEKQIMNKLQFIEDFSLGRISPSFNKFSIDALPLDGFYLALKYKESAISGFMGNSVPNVINMHSGTVDSWKMRGLKFNKKVTQDQSLTITGLRAFQTVSLQPFRRDNLVSTISHQFKSSKTGWETNLDFSSAMTDILREGQNINLQDRNVDHALRLDVGYEMRKLNSIIGLAYEDIGDEYFSAGNPFLRRAYKELSAFVKGNYGSGLFNYKIKVLRRIQKFPNNSNVNSTAEFDLRFKKNHWAIQTSYRPLSVVGGFVNVEGLSSYVNIEMNVFLFKVTRMKKIAKWTLGQNFIYTFNNSTTDNVVSSRFESYQGSLIARNRNIAINASFSRSFQSGTQLNQNFQDLVIDPLLSNTCISGSVMYVIKRKWTVSSDFNKVRGINLNSLQEYRTNASFSLERRIRVVNLGIRSSIISTSFNKPIYVHRINLSISI